MAFTFINGNGVTNGTSITSNLLTMSQTIGTGHLVTVLVAWGATSGTSAAVITSVTDTGSNTYTQAPSAFVHDTTFFRHEDVWYTITTNTATQITVHWDQTTGFGSVTAMEFSFGAGNNAVLDFATSLDQTTNAAPASPSMTPTVAGEVLVSQCNSNTTGENAVASPWTAGNQAVGDCCAYLIGPALSAQQALFSPTTAQTFVSTGAVFKEVSTGGTSRMLPLMGVGVG